MKSAIKSILNVLSMIGIIVASILLLYLAMVAFTYLIQ